MLKIKYKTSKNLVNYPEALQYMENAISSAMLDKLDEFENRIWFLEHPALYTEGVSANRKDLLDETLLPIHKTNRGGKFVYHGPGQRVAYLMLNLRQLFAPKSPDMRKYVFLLEQTIIEILKELGLTGMRIAGNPGIWVKTSGFALPQKIAFIGVKIKKWLSYHGVAFNIAPNLDHFKGIIPCGLDKYKITSLKQLNKNITMEEFDNLFAKKFASLAKEIIL